MGRGRNLHRVELSHTLQHAESAPGLPPNTHTKCQHCNNKKNPPMSKLAPGQHCPVEIYCLRRICGPASSPPGRSQSLLDSSLLLPSFIFSFPFLSVQPLRLTPGPAETSSWAPCFWPLPSIPARERPSPHSAQRHFPFSPPTLTATVRISPTLQCFFSDQLFIVLFPPTPSFPTFTPTPPLLDQPHPASHLLPHLCLPLGANLFTSCARCLSWSEQCAPMSFICNCCRPKTPL